MAISASTFTRLTRHTGYFPHRTNVGLIEAEDGLYLIDSGDCAQDGMDIIDSCSSLYPEKKIRAILNTHSHHDHSGGNSVIAEKTGCRTWATKSEAAILSNPDFMSVFYWGAECFDGLRAQGFVPTESNDVQRILCEETIVLDKNISVRCIFLPGHYFGQCGFLVTDSSSSGSAYFLGDACFGSQMLKKYWIPYMLNPHEFRKSLKKIEEQDADFYIPSHGELCDRKRICAVTELNAMATLETESLLLGILKKGPRTHEQILREAADYAGLDLKLSQFVLIGTTFRSYLSSMADRNLVDYAVSGNEMKWFIRDGKQN